MIKVFCCCSSEKGLFLLEVYYLAIIDWLFFIHLFFSLKEFLNCQLAAIAIDFMWHLLTGFPRFYVKLTIHLFNLSAIDSRRYVGPVIEGSYVHCIAFIASMDVHFMHRNHFIANTRPLLSDSSMWK